MSEKISISSEDLQKTKGVAERWELEIRKWDGLTHALLRSIRGNVGDTSTASMQDAYRKLSMESRQDLLMLAAELSEEWQRYYSPKKWLKKYQAWAEEFEAQSVIKESVTTESVPVPRRVVQKIESVKPKESIQPKLDVKDNSPEPTIEKKNMKTLQERISLTSHLEALKMITEKPIKLPNGKPLSKWDYFYSGSNVDNIEYALLPETWSQNVRLFDKPVGAGDYQMRVVYYLEKNPNSYEMTLKWTMIVKKDGSLTQVSWVKFPTPFDPKPIFQ